MPAAFATGSKRFKVVLSQAIRHDELAFEGRVALGESAEKVFLPTNTFP
jgi:hypothetical protein